MFLTIFNFSVPSHIFAEAARQLPDGYDQESWTKELQKEASDYKEKNGIHRSSCGNVVTPHCWQVPNPDLDDIDIPKKKPVAQNVYVAVGTTVASILFHDSKYEQQLQQVITDVDMWAYDVVEALKPEVKTSLETAYNNGLNLIDLTYQDGKHVIDTVTNVFQTKGYISQVDTDALKDSIYNLSMERYNNYSSYDSRQQAFTAFNVLQSFNNNYTYVSKVFYVGFVSTGNANYDPFQITFIQTFPSGRSHVRYLTATTTNSPTIVTTKQDVLTFSEALKIAEENNYYRSNRNGTFFDGVNPAISDVLKNTESSNSFKLPISNNDFLPLFKNVNGQPYFGTVENNPIYQPNYDDVWNPEKVIEYKPIQQPELEPIPSHIPVPTPDRYYPPINEPPVEDENPVEVPGTIPNTNPVYIPNPNYDPSIDASPVENPKYVPNPNYDPIKEPLPNEKPDYTKIPTFDPVTGGGIPPSATILKPWTLVLPFLDLLLAVVMYLLKIISFIATLPTLPQVEIDNEAYKWFRGATILGIKPYSLVMTLMSIGMAFSVYQIIRRRL